MSPAVHLHLHIHIDITQLTHRPRATGHTHTVADFSAIGYIPLLHYSTLY